MNIIVPLAGIDARFESRGLLKPLAPVNGIPIIRKIAESRPYSYSDAIFIILEEHERKYGIADKLEEFFGSRIRIVRAAQATQGAPQSILLAKEMIDSDDPMLIDLADQYLDLPGLGSFLEKTDADGVIPTFESLYYNRGYMKYAKDGAVAMVSEKDRVPISTHSTACLSYFARGSDFVDASEKMIKDKKVAANGAYLVSLAYNEMIRDGKKVLPFPCDFIGTLGTPEGVACFEQLDRPLRSSREIFRSSLLACKSISHRGLGFGEPENSLPAIDAALSRGLGVEIDVRFSSDGIAVLSHDLHTGRLMDKNLDIEKSNYETLNKLRFREKPYGIATMNDAVRSLATRSIGSLAIHIKGSYPQKQLATIFENAVSEGVQNRVFFVGTEKDSQYVLAAARNEAPQVKAGLHITLGGELPKKALLDAADVLWIDQLKEYEGSYKDIAKEAKKRGIPSVAMGAEFLLEAPIAKAQLIAKKIKADGVEIVCTDIPCSPVFA